MRAGAQTCRDQRDCARCQAPLDARQFDVSGFAAVPEVGGAAALARFTLPPQYCGVLEYFSQYTDGFARDPAAVETPGLRWVVLVNGRPLDPYLELEAILNPWGFGSFPVSVRLDEAAVVELGVRRTRRHARTDEITRLGGRLVGRYWYDASYGDVVQRRV